MRKKKTADELGYKKLENPKPGDRVHLSWAWNSCVWDFIVKLDNEKGVVQARGSGKYLIINLEDLRELSDLCKD
ncbi:MAG: hypothetical protein ACOCQR_03335 [bacterium]